jgi:GntR family transcriptional repressor for pyruvate dehydrogenase complex
MPSPPHGSDASGWENIDTSLRYSHGEKVSLVIARAIVRGIVENNLQPGAMLPPESLMLEHFRVGRASLREALRILEIQGLLTIRPGPGGGPVVAACSASDFGRMSSLYFEMRRATYGELVDARLLLEPVMARRAAERNDPALAANLRAVVNQPTSDASTPSERFRWASTFHGVITGASGNRVLDLMARGVKEVYFERVAHVSYLQEDEDVVQQQHSAIVDAIEAGDGDKAEHLMRTHMEEFVHRFRKRFPGMMDEIIDWR